MPGFNHKGPMGQGSMTGKKMGKCASTDAKNSGSADGVAPADKGGAKGVNAAATTSAFGGRGFNFRGINTTSGFGKGKMGKGGGRSQGQGGRRVQGG